MNHNNSGALERQHISYRLIYGLELSIDSVDPLLKSLNRTAECTQQENKENPDLQKISEAINSEFNRSKYQFLSAYIKSESADEKAKLILGYHAGTVEYDLIDIHNSYSTLDEHNKYYRSKLDDILDVWDFNKEQVYQELENLTFAIIKYCEDCKYDPDMTDKDAELHDRGITLGTTYYPGEQDWLCCKFFKINL